MLLGDGNGTLLVQHDGLHFVWIVMSRVSLNSLLIQFKIYLSILALKFKKFKRWNPNLCVMFETDVRLVFSDSFFASFEIHGLVGVLSRSRSHVSNRFVVKL